MEMGKASFAPNFTRGVGVIGDPIERVRSSGLRPFRVPHSRAG